MLNKLFVNAPKETVLECVRKAVCTNDAEYGCICNACRSLKNLLNPDVLFVDVDDKESMTATNFRKMLYSFYFTAKNMSRNKCIYIPDMDKMSITCQNAMLKFMEDNNDKAMVVGNCRDVEKILPTVKSRMAVVQNKKILSFDEFEKWCFENCIGESVMYYLLTSGDVSKVKQVGRCMDAWRFLIKNLPDREKMKDILKFLHLVKEKDKEAFCDKHPDMMLPMFTLMQQIFLCCIEKAHGEKPVIAVGNCNWSIMELFDNIAILSEEMSKLSGNYKAKDLTAFFIRLYKEMYY